VSSNIFGSGDLLNIKEIPLLFQTGYLTIKKINLFEGQADYTLDFPNKEVRDAFLNCLLNYYLADGFDDLTVFARKMRGQFANSDVQGLQESFTILLSHLPYSIQEKNEAYYHSIFLICLKLLGFNIRGEILTNRGRIDAVLEQQDYVVVIEIKFSVTKSLETMLSEALAQIRDKKYYEQYLNSGKRLSLLGVAFNGKDVDCKLESPNYSPNLV
jgi:hypothetical protein